MAQNNAAGKGRLLRLAAACVTMFALGFIYGWSVFSTPIAEEFQWEPATMSFTFTMLMWVFCAGGFIGAKICDHTSPRFTLIISAVSIFIAFCSCAYFANADAPFVLYFTYGLFGGLGVGMAYTVTMGTALAWFPDKAGTASGILLLCYGVSTMILSSVVAWLCSFMYWRAAFPLISGVMAAVIIAMAFVLRRPTDAEFALLPKPAAAAASNADMQKSKTTAQMVCTPAFWTYALWMIIMCTVSLGFTGNANQFGLAAGAEPALAVALVGVFSVCNGLGRFVNGLIFDALGLFKTILIVAIAHGLSAVFIILGLVNGSVLIMGFALAFAGVSIGGTPVCGSGFMATAFGPKHYSQNLAVLNLSIIPAALVGPLYLSLSISSTGSYVLGLGISAALTIVGAACAFATNYFMKRAK